MRWRLNADADGRLGRLPILMWMQVMQVVLYRFGPMGVRLGFAQVP